MQQDKIGCLLRKLRKERGMTQEQMAEVFGVTNRTVSRWENGNNMPDISILLEMSKYFEIGILELIEGERTGDTMMTEKGDGIERIANYAGERERIVLKNVHRTDIVGLIGCMLSGVALEAYVAWENHVWLLLLVILLGITGGTLSWNIAYASGLYSILNRKKKEYPFIKWMEIGLVVILLISICRGCYSILAGSFY